MFPLLPFCCSCSFLLTALQWQVVINSSSSNTCVHISTPPPIRKPYPCDVRRNLAPYSGRAFAYAVYLHLHEIQKKLKDNFASPLSKLSWRFRHLPPIHWVFEYCPLQVHHILHWLRFHLVIYYKSFICISRSKGPSLRITLIFGIVLSPTELNKVDSLVKDAAFPNFWTEKQATIDTGVWMVTWSDDRQA